MKNKIEKVEGSVIKNNQLGEGEEIEKVEEKEQETAVKKKGLAALWQFIKFGLVGVSNTVVSYAVFFICLHFLHTNAYIASLIGFILSVPNAFFWQNKFVFKESEEKEHRVWWQVLLKTYISYAFSGLFLTEVLLVFWLQILNISQYMGSAVEWLNGFGIIMTEAKVAETIAPFLNMVITIPINFCINKFWAYRQKSKKSEVETDGRN